MTAVDPSYPPPPSVPPPAEPKTSPWERIVGVFFSPSETFASIARRPDIGVPLTILLLCSVLIGAIIGLKVDFAAAALENMPPNASAAQMEQGAKMAGTIGRISSFVSPVFVIIGLVIIAGVLLLAFRIMGGEGNFQQAFSVVTYASMPSVVKSLIMGIVILARGGVPGTEMETLVLSNPAFLVEQKAHPVLFSALTSLDVFTIWYVILLVIGFAAISRFSKAKSATIIVSLWAIAVAIKLAFVSFGAMMRAKQSA